MKSFGKGWTSAAAMTIASALTMVLLLVCGCSSTTGPDKPQEQAGGGRPAFDPSSLAWDPSALEAHLPAIVGWHQGSAGGPAELVVLSEESSAVAVWSAPAGVASRLVALDPRSGTLAVSLAPTDERAFPETTYLCGPDGSVTEVDVPDGYDGLTSMALLPDGSALALATAYGPESIDATTGIISAEGSWSPVALIGDLPEYQYVENLFGVPGTEDVAVVLKTLGTPANRDDEALVLTRWSDAALVSFTPPYREDSLPNAVPLQAREGVAFVRSWRIDQRGQAVPELVETLFSGSGWVERVLVSDHGITTGIESGTVAVALPDGTMLVRSAAPHDSEQRSQLLKVEHDGTLAETGMDVTDTTHLLWMSN